MNICNEWLNNYISIFSTFIIGSNIFYLITSLLFFFSKDYFNGIVFLIMTTVSVIHHIFNYVLYNCDDLDDNKFSFLTYVDEICVGIICIIMLIQIIRAKKPLGKKWILIILLAIFGLSMWFLSIHFSHEATNDIDIALSLESSNRKSGSIKDSSLNSEINIYKLRYILKENLYESGHGIWHLLTGLIGIVVYIHLHP